MLVKNAINAPCRGRSGSHAMVVAVASAGREVLPPRHLPPRVRQAEEKRQFPSGVNLPGVLVAGSNSEEQEEDDDGDGDGGGRMN